MLSQFPTRVVRSAFWAGLVLVSCATGLTVQAAEAPAAAIRSGAEVEPSAAQLKALASAAEAELWLETVIPVGFTLREAPAFFEAADEVFYEAEEDLLVFAYRSSVTGKWIAWVAFDADRTGVVHSAAIDLDR